MKTKIYLLILSIVFALSICSPVAGLTSPEMNKLELEMTGKQVAGNSEAVLTDRFKKLDAYLQGLENEDSFSGIVVIAKNGEILFSKMTGFADRENRIKIKLDTQFELSSTSKLFTGTSVVKLIQEGKIKANDKIGKYLPELKDGHKVTVHHLLTHSSGYADVYNVEGFSYTKVKSCRDVIRFIKKQELKFNPGEGVYYSESGMMILGALIEMVSGMSYQDYVTKNILEPLGMNHTSFINDVDATESNDGDGIYAQKYVKNENNRIVRQTFDEEAHVFIPLAAGGVWSSAGDLIKFDEGIWNYKILKEEFVELMINQYIYTGWPDCYYGYIWTTINSGKNEAVGHGGNSRGHHSNYLHFKKDGTVMVVLTNYGFVDIFEVCDKVEEMLVIYKPSADNPIVQITDSGFLRSIEKADGREGVINGAIGSDYLVVLKDVDIQQPAKNLIREE